MKILQINDDYQKLGGAETYFFNLIELLEKKGHQVFVFVLRGQDTREVKTPARWSRSRPPRRWRGNNKRRIYTKNTLVVGAPKGLLPGYFSSKIFNFKVYFKLKKFIAEVKPDIIHLHNNYLAPFSVLLAIQGRQVIQTVHDYKMVCPYGEMIKKNNLKICQGNIGLKCFKNQCLSLHNLLISYLPFRLRAYLTKKVISQFLSPSKKLKGYLENFGFQNVHHLPYFLDVKRYKFNPALRKRGHILYLGRLVKTKGVDSLFRALPKIISALPEASLTVVGDGPQKKELIFLAKTLKIADKVNFIGRVPHSQVKKYYQQANVVVVPSLCLDNSPNVVYEAFSAGRPVVASNRGGMADFVKDGKTGFIFGPKDTSDGGQAQLGLLRGGEEKKKDLAEKIIIILKNDKLFREMSFNCRQFALDNFTPENHYQKIKKIYENCHLSRSG